MTRICFEVSPRSRRSVIELAAVLRQSSGRTTSPWFDVQRFAELDLPNVWPEFNLTIGDVHEMGHDHGLTFPDQHEVRLRADVYEGLCQGRGRDRFTLAHEIGHYVMHSTPGMARTLRERTKIPAYRDSEWQANTFAGSLLVALDVARQHPRPEELALVCGVTVEAAKAQLGNYRIERML